MSNSSWYTNGVQELKVRNEDTPPEGFYKGRKPVTDETRKKMGASQKGHPIYRKTTNKGMTYSEQAHKNMSEAKHKFLKEHPEWKSPSSFVKGQKPWNVGIPMQEESKRKISNANKGKSCVWKGKHLSDETKKKLSNSLKGKTSWNKGKTNCYSKETIEKIRNARIGYKLSDESLEMFRKHTYITKKKNHSFNTSKPEDRVYNKLVTKFGIDNVIRQYRDENRYPFYCDFYVKSCDLFIECNFTWTHGGHLFDCNSNEDCAIENIWKEKAKKSKYYELALKVWTQSDVLKHDTMIKNNLNAFVAYKEVEVDDFISKI